jgi:hypothetical protein
MDFSKTSISMSLNQKIKTNKRKPQRLIEKRNIQKKHSGKYNNYILRYNRLVDNTTFSPPASSFLCNLKKDFPKVFNKY